MCLEVLVSRALATASDAGMHIGCRLLFATQSATVKELEAYERLRTERQTSLRAFHFDRASLMHATVCGSVRFRIVRAEQMPETLCNQELRTDGVLLRGWEGCAPWCSTETMSANM